MHMQCLIQSKSFVRACAIQIHIFALQAMQQTIDFYKKQRQEQHSMVEELKAKLMVQVKENSELLEQFRVLKNHHVKLAEEQLLNYSHINASQCQLEAKDRVIKEKDRVIKDKENQLADKELEIVTLSHQIMIAEQSQVSSM